MKMELRGSSATLLFLAASLLVFFAGESAAKTFNCSSRSTCQALVGYVPRNDTSLSQVQTLFGVKNLRSLLGANGLPATTPSSYRVPANHTFSILFQCVCGSNGSATGTSHGRPVYVVRKGDDAYEIATHIFGGLVTYEEIAAANGLPDPSRIDVDQRLQIPLPCSCDKVDGSDVVHYGHVVAAGSTVRGIAAEFGTDETTLMRLNAIADPKDLLAGDVLDVPLKACTSAVGRGSLDYPVLVSNGTYVYTAQNCVKCKCDAANNWTLSCEPSKLSTSKNSPWSACPAVRCEGKSNLPLGETTTSTPCSQTCAYAGYNNQTILASLTNASTCPSPSPSESYAATIYTRGWSWSPVFIAIHLALFLLLLV